MMYCSLLYCRGCCQSILAIEAGAGGLLLIACCISCLGSLSIRAMCKAVNVQGAYARQRQSDIRGFRFRGKYLVCHSAGMHSLNMNMIFCCCQNDLDTMKLFHCCTCSNVKVEVYKILNACWYC
jgi:hypothetical protein